MAWKYDNHPAGFYVSVPPGYPGLKAIVHLTGTKKGIKYNRPLSTGGAFYTLMWNCVNLDDPDFPYVYCATEEDVRKQFATDADILDMIGTWQQ